MKNRWVAFVATASLLGLSSGAVAADDGWYRVGSNTRGAVFDIKVGSVGIDFTESGATVITAEVRGTVTGGIIEIHERMNSLSCKHKAGTLHSQNIMYGEAPWNNASSFVFGESTIASEIAEYMCANAKHLLTKG